LANNIITLTHLIIYYIYIYVYILINIYKCVDLYELKIAIICLSILKISRPLITHAYRTKTVLIALVATKPNNDY